MLHGLRNVRVTTIPEITRLVPPIQTALRKVMAGQFTGDDEQLAEALGKAPGEKPWELDIDRWLQKLVAAQTIYHGDRQYGVYYKRYFIDRPFSESTISTSIRLVPSLMAANVVAMNEKGGGGPLVG